MSCELVEFNWLIDNSEIERFLKRRKLKVKFRYRQADIDVKELTLHDRKKSVSVKLYRRERAITPGQYAVFYQGEICIGGGLIRKTDRLDEFCNPLLNY
jgi:tRNA-specific 2-thiouridylase